MQLNRMTSHYWFVACKIILSLLIACLWNAIDPLHTAGYLIPLTVFLVTIFNVAMPITIVLRRCIIILFAYIFIFAVLTYLPQQIILGLITAIVLLFGWLLIKLEPLTIENLVEIALPLLLLLIIWGHYFGEPLRFDTNVLQIIIGALIGGVTLSLFANRPYSLFRLNVLPLLKQNADLLAALEQVLTMPTDTDVQLAQQKQKLIQALQFSSVNYPEWVFAVGFNVFLRSGFRYFLIELGQLQAILFSMAAFVLKADKMPGLVAMRDLFSLTLKNNQILLQQIMHYFKTQRLLPSTDNYTNDLAELELQVQNYVPQSYELLDLSPEYLTLIALVRDLKDMRNILLQLLLTLPEVGARASYRSDA